MTTDITSPTDASTAGDHYPSLLKEALEAASGTFAGYTADDQRIIYRDPKQPARSSLLQSAYRLEAIQTLLEILERSNMEILLSAIEDADKAHFHEQINALHEKRQARSCLD